MDTTRELSDWLDHLDALWEGDGDPALRAERGGRAAGSVAFAFVAGFRTALEVLVPDAGRAALCLSEERGAHPRYLKTSLRDGRLIGRKSWTTLGPLAASFLVAAVRGVLPDGRNDIVLVKVPADREGVRIVPMPPTPFVPEIPHCHVEFDVDAIGLEVLPGAAFDRYVRPFRTWEDSYICLALGALLHERALESGQDLWAASLQAVLDVLRLAPTFEVSDPRWHLLLHHCLERLQALSAPDHPGMRALPQADQALWARDMQLLHIASKARALRRQRALDKLAAVG